MSIRRRASEECGAENVWYGDSRHRRINPDGIRSVCNLPAGHDGEHKERLPSGGATVWASRRQAGSMEQEMGNMGESFDGGNSAGGGAGPGGYIYDVSDYDTYAATYNTITDVPTGADDSAPATTGSRHIAGEPDDGYGTYDGMNDALAGVPPLFTLTNLADVAMGTDEWDYINAYVVAYNQYA